MRRSPSTAPPSASSPTTPPPTTTSARLLGQQGKLDEAIAEHRTAIRIQPDFANAHNTLGDILSDVKQDYAAAAAEFREAIRLQPDFATCPQQPRPGPSAAGEAG